MYTLLVSFQFDWVKLFVETLQTVSLHNVTHPMDAHQELKCLDN